MNLRPKRPRLFPGRVVILWAIALLLPGLGSFRPEPTGISAVVTPRVNPVQPPPPAVTGLLRFNGVDASTAATPATAMSLDIGSSIPIAFQWTARGGKLGEPGLVAIASERLQSRVLGAAVITSSHAESPPVLASMGSANYSVSYAEYRWIVEGLFALTGALLAPNGTALWSLTFYVHVLAPFHATVLNVAGVAILAYLLVFVILRPGRTPPPGVPAPRSDPDPLDADDR